MQQLRQSLWNNIFTHDLPTYHSAFWNRMEDFSTIILGETGTGKGTAAAAMGSSASIAFDINKERFSRSFTTSFVTANLSEFSEGIIESELFGHKKGAFTGAIEHHQGLLAQCGPNGVLFLDEIGEVSASVQIKLLRVLQDRSYMPVGSHQQQRFSGRVIAATNQPLEILRRQGKFRDDFYYRLCSDVITVPPLRQRLAECPSELESLVNKIVTRISGNDDKSITGLIMERLSRDLPSDYTWPGNVRELEQAVRRILLTGCYQGDKHYITDNSEEQLIQQVRSGKLAIKPMIQLYCQMLYQRLGNYEAVAKQTKLNWRTVKKYIAGSDE